MIAQNGLAAPFLRHRIRLIHHPVKLHTVRDMLRGHALHTQMLIFCFFEHGIGIQHHRHGVFSPFFQCDLQ